MPPAAHDVRAAALAAELRALIGTLKRRLRQQSDAGDLTPSQVSVLLRLEKLGPASVSDLARAEGVRPQSMAAVVAGLDAAGLVQGAPDPADGRRTLLTLTERCRRWVRDGRAARQDWLARRLQSRLSAEDLDVLAQATGLLARLVDD